MRVVLINPNLLVLPHDLFATGIAQLPLGLASVAATLRQAGVEVAVLDAYGQRPHQVWREEPFLVYGLECEEVAGLVPPETDLVFLYAHQAIQAALLPSLLRALEQAHPDLPVIVLENTQARPAFPLAPLTDLLLEAGADAVLCGEAEESAVRLVRALVDQTEPMDQIPGLHGGGLANPTGEVPDLDELPCPAWDLFPLRSHWSGWLADGPLSTGRYLPVYLSRTAPPATRLTLLSESSPPTWRCRSPEHAVEEIGLLRERYKVREFHIEDLEPTVDEGWLGSFCDLLCKKRWTIEWKIVNPCHLECLSEKTLGHLARAGCRYLSFALDARSVRGLALALPAWIDVFHRVAEMSRVGIRSQACLDPGWPGDTEMDRPLLGHLVHDLAKCGLDEIDLSSRSRSAGQPEPYPAEGGHPVKDSAEYALARLQRELFTQFLRWKVRYHPWKVVRQGVNLMLRRFETKTEMSTYRAGVHRVRSLWGRRPQTTPALAPATEHHEEAPAKAA